jgi:hypothetical protein
VYAPLVPHQIGDVAVATVPVEELYAEEFKRDIASLLEANVPLLRLDRA